MKGKNTTPDSMYKEWICAHLADHLNLPIPDFALVELPPELIEALPSDLADIGAGVAFGSKSVLRPVWFEQASISDISPELQRRVVAFDWWIQNVDRSQHNPNFLLDQGDLVVIDHNNAFDTDFDPEQFIQQLIPLFDKALSEAPSEWKWYDPEATVPGNFDADH